GLGLGVVRAPLDPALHLAQLVLADLAAAVDASEVRILGVLFDGGQHIGPLEHLMFAALQAGQIGPLLAPLAKAAGDPASGPQQRGGDLEQLGELGGARAAVGLFFRVAAGFISHLDRSSCTWRATDTCERLAGELAPEIRMAPRPSTRSLNRMESEPSRAFCGKIFVIAVVFFNIGASFIFDQRTALSVVGWTTMKSPAARSMVPRTKMLATTVPPIWADLARVTVRQGSSGPSAARISLNSQKRTSL